jgi:pheromone shutdown protein TraB
MLSEMTGEFPSITEVFVNERDAYLAHSLLLATQQDFPSQNPNVVAVVGMGHVKGITKLFGNTTETHIQNISK